MRPHLRSTSHRSLVLATALLAGVVALAVRSPASLLNAVSSGGRGYRQRNGIVYGPLARQRLDAYTPTAAAPPTGWPVVVFFHGGTWNSGERADYRFVGRALATRGVLTLVADYRLHPEVHYPEFLRDSALALAHALAHARSLGGDPARVFAMGHSAGAYNAAMLALDPRWLAATRHAPRELAGWIGLAGPYDFLPSDRADIRAVFEQADASSPPPAGVQPIDHADARTVPAWLGTAADDRVVDPDRSTRRLATRLEAAGTPVTLRLYPRASHVTLLGALAPPLRWIAPVLDDVVAFVDTTPPAGSPPAGTASRSATATPDTGR